MKQYYSIILGGLLHDIGKFVQRAQPNPKPRNHSQWGAEWFDEILREKLLSNAGFDVEMVRSAINNHHAYEPLISLADAISAGMDRLELSEEESGDPFSGMLISIFSRIAVSSMKRREMYHQLNFLNAQDIQESFPVGENHSSHREYAALLVQFNNEIIALNFSSMKPESIVNFFMFLLWKYAWCIPSAVYRHEPDISLFDHMKTTAAAAACLYAYTQEKAKKTADIKEPAFRLIGGDISGIQNYIFGALKQTEKIAKRLRARSFYVQMLSEIACHKILHAFDLPLCNVMIAAGGNFYILTPNTNDSESKLSKLQGEFDAWCMNHVAGEISISLADIAVSGMDLKNFSTVLEKLKSRLAEKKCRPLFSSLSEDGKWVADRFLMPQVIESEEKVCQGCGKYPMMEAVRNEDGLCGRCDDDVGIGQKLPKKQYIAFFAHAFGGFEMLNYSFALMDDKDLSRLRASAQPYLILVLNSTSMKSPVNGFKFLSMHVPRLNDFSGAEPASEDIASFIDIAGAAEGDKLLGFVKIDVDNLGTILREGFAGKEVRNKSISRYAALSRMLETFFCGHIHAKMNSGYRQLYSVFSGGDDLFVIGPWDQAVRFAGEIRKDFERFCAGNPDFTFSCGFLMSKPQEPVTFCSDAVELRLEQSKNYEGKNCITFFDQTMTWGNLDRVIAEARRMIGWMEGDPPIVSKGLAQNLRRYGEMSDQYFASKETDIQCLKFVPLLSYDIGRLLKKPEQRDAALWAEALKPTLERSKGGDMLPFLKTIMACALTYTRR